MQVFPWLLRHKITVPDQTPGYVHRAELVSRAMPTGRRLTVLHAAGGFGKTTLLAECCRRLRWNGVPTAWVSLDEHDGPAVLDIYIAFACHSAGLDLLDAPDLEVINVGPESRIGLVAHAIQAFGSPFVIAFDELERLRDPASVSLLEFLLQRGPSNLHLAIACRQIPDGLNVTGAVLGSGAEVLTTEDLRFSKPEVARFFELGLSRSELATAMDRSAGWPIAVQILRNQRERGAETDTRVARDFVTNWIESRLFAGLAPDDRDLLLDIGLFDWMDAALLDEALQCTHTMRRVDSMRALAGLLEPVGGGVTESRRLHPLVRRHCAERRFQESPQRFRAIHRRIAEALMRRGDTVSAMRHAVEGGDPVLAGHILERAGGIRLWMREGLVPIRAADRCLNEDTIRTRPRLALVRCLVLLMSWRLDEARKLCREVAATSRAGEEDGRDGDFEDFEYLVDECVLRGVMALYGAERVGSSRVRALSGDYERLVDSKRLDPFMQGYMEYALCVLHQFRAEFDAAVARLAAASRFLARSGYISAHAETLRGQVAMAQGNVQDAELHYRMARSMARKNRALDPMTPAGLEVMLQELALECGRLSPAAELRGVPRALMMNSVPLSGIAAASGLVIELKLRAGRIDLALDTANELLEYARGVGLTALARHLAALRISVLVVAGRVGDAERAWRLENLPEDAEGCVDLAGQGWREMEAVACARLRCLIACERFDEARDLARKLRSVAVERRLRRIFMRALALSIVLEQRAREPGSAAGRLEEYLGLYAESPYAWPLVRERAICEPVVVAFLDRNPDSPWRESARSLLAAMRGVADVRALVLSERERAVLLHLESRRDKQIAAVLGLTVHGVRYHMRSLFSKLGAGTRAEAVLRARALGLIPDDS